MEYKRRHHVSNKVFTKENDKISTQKNFLAANIPSNLKLFCKNTRIQMRGPNAGGGGGNVLRYYIPGTATQAYFPFLFYLLINQIYVPHTNGV